MENFMRNLILLCAFAAFVQAQPIRAATTTIYSYDAFGRLIATSTSDETGVTVASYSYDKADNRATPSTRKSKAVIVPLNGYTVIPVPEN